MSCVKSESVIFTLTPTIEDYFSGQGESSDSDESSNHENHGNHENHANHANHANHVSQVNSTDPDESLNHANHATNQVNSDVNPKMSRIYSTENFLSMNCTYMNFGDICLCGKHSDAQTLYFARLFYIPYPSYKYFSI